MKKYEQIYEKFKGDLIDGNIPYGKKLPSKRATAEIFGVSVVTVETAYEILESEGYIEAKSRSGYYSKYATNDLIHEKTASKALLENSAFSENLAENEKTNFPFSVYSSAVRDVLNDYGYALLQKTDGSGLPQLKTAIKNYLKISRDITVEEDQIIIGSGAESLYSIITKLLGKDKIYGLEEPSYTQIEKVYISDGVKVEKLKLGKDGIPSNILNGTKAEILHVTPYRSFPTGVTASASKKAEYLHFASAHNGYIIEDDYESEFSLNARLTETLFGSCKDNRVIYINTFSKTICPSIRVGYALLPKELAKKYHEKLGFYSCSVPTLEQYVIAKLLNDGSFVRHLNRVRRQKKQYIVDKATKE